MVTIMYAAQAQHGPSPGGLRRGSHALPVLSFPSLLCDNVLLKSPPWLFLHTLSFENLGSYPWEGQLWEGPREGPVTTQGSRRSLGDEDHGRKRAGWSVW